MGFNSLDDSREGIEIFLRHNPDTCFVAEEDGEINGAIMVGCDGRRGYIYHTAVRSGWRGRGIGAGMVDRAMKALEEKGIHKAALVAFARNEDGNAFWEKQGFGLRTDLVYRDRAIAEMQRIET